MSASSRLRGSNYGSTVKYQVSCNLFSIIFNNTDTARKIDTHIPEWCLYVNNQRSTEAPKKRTNCGLFNRKTLGSLYALDKDLNKTNKTKLNSFHLVLSLVETTRFEPAPLTSHASARFVK